MTPAEIRAESDRLMAAISGRVALIDAIRASVSCNPRDRRRVREECRELRALNRADSKRLCALDIAWERLAGGRNVAA